MYGILSEIVGKWYTRSPVADSNHIVPLLTANSDTANAATSSTDDDADGKLWCYCDKPSFGDMVLCDNKKCTIQWFHFDCLQLPCAPEGKWYCPSCRKLPPSLINRRTRNNNVNTHSSGTTDGHKFIHAQHTFAILSIMIISTLQSLLEI